MSRRERLALIVAACGIAASAAACAATTTSESASSQTATRTVAATTAETQQQLPPPPPLLPVGCADEVAAANDQGAELAGRLVDQGRRVARLDRQALAAQDKLKQSETLASTRKAELDAAQAAYAEAADELNAFLEVYGTVLDEPEYSQAVALREAAVATEEEYSAALAAYNAAVRGVNRDGDAYNRRVGRFNSASEQLNRQVDRYDAILKEHHNAIRSCVAMNAEWDASTASLEASLAPTLATITGVQAASAECESDAKWGEEEAAAKIDDPDYELGGYVLDRDTTMHLAPELCVALAAQLAEPARELDCLRQALSLNVPACPPAIHVLADAVVTTAHEAQHVMGVAVEAKAQCWGLQAVAQLGPDLGIPERSARQLARYAHRAITVPPRYRSRQCRDGGALDLNPNSSVWP